MTTTRLRSFVVKYACGRSITILAVNEMHARMLAGAGVVSVVRGGVT